MKFGIGQAVTRREDDRLLTGAANTPTDLRFTNESHLVLLRAPHAHARILSIDTAAAQAAPDVLAIFTGAQLWPTACWRFRECRVEECGRQADERAPFFPLATDVVRFVGQPVVAVIAGTRSAAESAASEVMVDYEPLPADRIARCGAGARAPVLWPDSPGNVPPYRSLAMPPPATPPLAVPVMSPASTSTISAWRR